MPDAAAPMLASQRITQISLYLISAIAIMGGALQMYLGRPETLPRLDNVHRFMGGIYLMCGVIALWTAATIQRHDMLIMLLAAAVLVGGLGRVLSIVKVGLPDPAALWIGYLVPELVFPFIIIGTQLMTNHRLARIPVR
jgi:hypothetical protein